MPLSQLVLPSFTLVLSDSGTLGDFQRAQSREIHIPLSALSNDEDFMHTIDFRTAPAPAFTVHKSTYCLDADAASLFKDVKEGLISDGYFWQRLKIAVSKVKDFGGRIFTA
ncbi:uncharacterized protein LACBIDRAFT_293606 [Laccaria bicolor S238N-H82]|uniref:Predicted protein n=1 Tax=Laccaria bicolor (strain S238N-H82 / ATCC MYA-4686) TaxID=486041 RepID=B0D4K1_LACBS|nr:uncharacterized protein LACBIDRAFT_293606 [Laccaria bicolor S238N-H82]EDR10578.1 predicted protein [Laccaria bicolor S238N-H82]|eukprot:XP_001879028.1 predicted protein [Laccaria bicolor S238N-H82]